MGVTEKVGDLLFAVASLSRLAGHNPELALRSATRKFKRRFAALERTLKKTGRKRVPAGLEEMEQIWDGLKKGGL